MVRALRRRRPDAERLPEIHGAVAVDSPGVISGRGVAAVGLGGFVGLAAVITAGAAAFVRGAAAGHLYAEAEAPSSPVALVLGAQVYPDGTPSPFLAARLDVARRLWLAGRVDSLLVSGDSAAAEHDEPQAMRAYLEAAGVPAERILQDPGGFDTYESCLRARDVYGLRWVTVVSQSYHLPRAVGTARLLGLDAVGVGDESLRWIVPGRVRSRSWRIGAVRDVLACVKTVADLLLRPQPRSAVRPPPRTAQRPPPRTAVRPPRNRS